MIWLKNAKAALNNDAFKNTEVMEWSFRGKHFYKWYKKEHIVAVSWKITTKSSYTPMQQEKSEVFIRRAIKIENKKYVYKQEIFLIMILFG